MKTSIRKRMKNAKVVVDLTQVSEQASNSGGKVGVVVFELGHVRS